MSFVSRRKTFLFTSFKLVEQEYVMQNFKIFTMPLVTFIMHVLLEILIYLWKYRITIRICHFWLSEFLLFKFQLHFLIELHTLRDLIVTVLIQGFLPVIPLCKMSVISTLLILMYRKIKISLISKFYKRCPPWRHYTQRLLTEPKTLLLDSTAAE